MSPREQAEIEQSTRGQSSCAEWARRRRHRLTASNFGRVVKLRESTAVHNTVPSILYPDNIDTVPGVQWGRSARPLPTY